MEISFETRIEMIQELFEEFDGRQASNFQVEKVRSLKIVFPELIEDLDFCFEVLAGKHKVGYSAYRVPEMAPGHEWNTEGYTIKEWYKKFLTPKDFTTSTVHQCMTCIRPDWQDFFIRLINREYRLGYSNKAAMLTDYTAMLCNKWPEKPLPKEYILQEKYDGNRLIAHYEDGEWKFTTRNGLPAKTSFDMNWANTDWIYDGEVVGEKGTAGFQKASGQINSKSGDKSSLRWIIYDKYKADEPNMSFALRFDFTDNYSPGCEAQCNPCHGNCYEMPENIEWAPTIWGNMYSHCLLGPNATEREVIIAEMDRVLQHSGEGIIIRDMNAPYKHGRGNAVLKLKPDYLPEYKCAHTHDVRIIGVYEGKSKYRGMLGGFKVVEEETGTTSEVGSGLTNEQRKEWWTNPPIGQICEIMFNDITPDNSYRFPRFKRMREDKTETSRY